MTGKRTGTTETVCAPHEVPWSCLLAAEPRWGHRSTASAHAMLFTSYHIMSYHVMSVYLHIHNVYCYHYICMCFCCVDVHILHLHTRCSWRNRRDLNGILSIYSVSSGPCGPNPQGPGTLLIIYSRGWPVRYIESLSEMRSWHLPRTWKYKF